MTWIYKTHCSFAMDSLLPKDQIVMTPWFSDTVNGTQDSIRDSLYDAFITSAGAWFTSLMQTTIKVYEWTGIGVDMGPPKSEKTWNAGVTATSVLPREIALCLSFYADANVKRQRGRLYLPLGGSSYSTAALRPSGAMLTKALTVATKLGAVGAGTTKWIVHSDVDGQSRPVTSAWCDDEWDTQRRRGLRSTTRSSVAITA